MPTFKNESAETFTFPSLGIIVEPGDTFDADVDVTTGGIVVASGKKKADVAPVDSVPAAPAEAPVDSVPAAPAEAPVDSVPAAPAEAPVTTAEEGK